MFLHLHDARGRWIGEMSEAEDATTVGEKYNAPLLIDGRDSEAKLNKRGSDTFEQMTGI